MVVPSLCEPLGKSLFEVVDVRAATLFAFVTIEPFGSELQALLSLVVWQAALLILLATAAGAGIIASGFGHPGQHLEARVRMYFVCNLAGGCHPSRFSP